MVSGDTFEPKYATIVRDKDEYTIPLLVDTIPTPKVDAGIVFVGTTDGLFLFFT
jgi:hypothetical protein